MKKGKQLVEELRELVEAVPPQFQKKNGNGNDNGEKGNGGGNGKTKTTIKTLADTDYKDKDAFFKMVQLLKGLAANADKDEMAAKFLKKVSDELTDAAEDVMEEGVEVDDDGDELHEAVDKEIMDVAFEYLRKNSKKFSDLTFGMSREVKKKTGKGIGFKHIREIFAEFMKVGQ